MTKLARRYHQNREDVLATPARPQTASSDKSLLEKTDLPPFVTVRKTKKSSPKSVTVEPPPIFDLSLDSTVVNLKAL